MKGISNAARAASQLTQVEGAVNRKIRADDVRVNARNQFGIVKRVERFACDRNVSVSVPDLG